MASQALPNGRHQPSLAVPLLLVDGNNLLWRAAYGFPRRIRSRNGADVTAVFGFMALLRKALGGQLSERECVVLFDTETSLHARVAVNASYKSGRTQSDIRAAVASTAFELLPHLLECLSVVGITWAEAYSYEADDAIAAITAHVAPLRDVLIMSTDRDFYQLIHGHVRILNTTRKPERWFVGLEEVVERFGVWPHQWCDFRALMGDPSDGIKGVHGVGPVWAARLLADGIGLAELPTSGRLVGRIGEAVLAEWEDVLSWKELCTLRTDVPPQVLLTGHPTGPLPLAAEALEWVGIWDI